MSNDVSKQLGTVDPAFAHLKTKRLGEGIFDAMPIIVYKAHHWALRIRGERYPFTRADDGSQATSIDVIVLSENEFVSKTYYPPPYDDSSTSPPVCFSLKGDVPDPGAEEPQNPTCADCPQNAWIPGKGRACKDGKRVAVLLMPAATRRMTGAALEEPALLRINPASLGSWRAYGNQLIDMGFPHPAAVVTRISWNPDPKKSLGWQMVFRAVQKLTAKEAPMVLPFIDAPQTMRILGVMPAITQLQEVKKPALAKPAAEEEPVETGFAEQEVIPPRKTAPQAAQAAAAKAGGRGRPPGSKNKPKTNGQPATTAKAAPPAKEEPVELDDESEPATAQATPADEAEEVDTGFTTEMEDLLSDKQAEVDDKISKMMK